MNKITKKIDDKPIIVQSDLTILLERYSPLYEEARDKISVFAELVKSPEYIHTYKISAISIWSSAYMGYGYDYIINTLKNYSRYDIPEIVIKYIKEKLSIFGKVKLLPLRSNKDKIILQINDDEIHSIITSNKKLQEMISERINKKNYIISSTNRGFVKEEFIKMEIPVDDRVGVVDGESIDIERRITSKSGIPFNVRGYQIEAANTFYKRNKSDIGYGIIAMPCGAGKTIVGIEIITRIKEATLIICANVQSVQQWKRELIDKTTITENQIGEYTGDKKQIRDITIATYQVIIGKGKKGVDRSFRHFPLFNEKNWGLIIYDEVHLLPAPVFKMTALIQSRRRLGLSATLIREDGKEKDIFALIGPKRYDIPWKELERKNWIAHAICIEYRIQLPKDEKIKYLGASPRERIKIAAQNPNKLPIIKNILKRHRDDNIIIIGHYINQLRSIANEFGARLITGSTPNNIREGIYQDFREGKIKILVLSKVANFAIDLPNANIAIQVSGSFGSRQEEAQRLGRILRPKEKDSYFYSLVSEDTIEQEFAAKRQLFLIEQGYNYKIESTNL